MRWPSRVSLRLAAVLILLCLPALSEARAIGGQSVGSRGSHTYAAPPGTASAPYGASGFQSSLTPRGSLGYSSNYGRDYGMRPGSAFTSGLLGGFLGAGLGGLLFGGGFFGGMHGGPGVLGLLLQLFLVYMLASWAYRRFAGTLAPAGSSLYGRMFYSGAQTMPGAARPGFFGGGRTGRPIALTSDDYRSFEELLRCIQAAWSAQDLTSLKSMATPEMVGYFAEQLAEQASRGARNQVTDVRLEKGELSEAWAEGTREYATVCMRFSMVDATLDSVGRLLDGSLTEHVTATEFWTFLRAPRARWVLSAIQQPK